MDLQRAHRAASIFQNAASTIGRSRNGKRQRRGIGQSPGKAQSDRVRRSDKATF
jgi:hypothetical protein